MVQKTQRFFPCPKVLREKMKKKDILAPIEAQIINKVNSTQKEYLELYAKYFAKASNPENISMKEIDSTGIIFRFTF